LSATKWDIRKALSVGIIMERGAQDLYTDTSSKARDPGSKQLLKELASDEAKHRAYFEAALKDPKVIGARGTSGKVMDLKISDPLREVQLSPNATYQETLIFAAKSEQTAHDFYSALAKAYSSSPIGKVWAEFADMEAGHKLRLEKEYDDVVLKEN
jgi:rubrerythrin